MTNHNSLHLITTKEAAEMLKVSQLTVYRWIKTKRLPAYKIGKNIRIKLADLDSLVELHKL